MGAAATPPAPSNTMGAPDRPASRKSPFACLGALGIGCMVLVGVVSATVVAIALLVAVAAAEGRVRVTVYNHGPDTIRHAVLRAPGMRQSAHAIRPGGRRRLAFHPRRDGAVELELYVSGHERSGVVIDYTTSGLGGSVDVRVFGPDNVLVSDTHDEGRWRQLGELRALPPPDSGDPGESSR